MQPVTHERVSRSHRVDRSDHFASPHFTYTTKPQDHGPSKAPNPRIPLGGHPKTTPHRQLRKHHSENNLNQRNSTSVESAWRIPHYHHVAQKLAEFVQPWSTELSKISSRTTTTRRASAPPVSTQDSMSSTVADAISKIVFLVLFTCCLVSGQRAVCACNHTFSDCSCEFMANNRNLHTEESLGRN